jgi:hypothetical protein
MKARVFNMHIGVSITPFGHHPGAWREKTEDAIHFNALAAQVKQKKAVSTSHSSPISLASVL